MSSRPLVLPPEYEFGPFSLKIDGSLVADNARYLHLPPKELQVLRVLLGAQGRLVDQDDLIAQVWPGGDVACESLTRCIYSLRKILGAHKHFIATVYGRGYRFQGPLKALPVPLPGRSMAPSGQGGSPRWRTGLASLASYTPGSLRDACRTFRQVLLDEPECWASWNGLATSLIGQAAMGRPTGKALLKEIEQAVGRSLDANPANPQALVLLAFVISAQGGFDGAQALFRVALEQDAGPLALYYQAWHRWCWGMDEQARHTLDACLSDLPYSLPAWILRVRLAFAQSTPHALQLVCQAREQTDSAHPMLVGLHAMLMAFAGHAAAGRALLERHRLDASLELEPGLLRCYVIARLDRREARREFRLWQMEHGAPPLCPAQMCVLRLIEGDGAVLVAWREMQAKDCVWLRPQLADPRLLGLTAAR